MRKKKYRTYLIKNAKGEFFLTAEHTFLVNQMFFVVPIVRFNFLSDSTLFGTFILSPNNVSTIFF